ncbi:hypothetical protein [Agrobacterium radiobacter]|uniref:hypothetical protein n=1 Tax=Agrobacterium radiobacter TaxID=362 RepID=UPI000761B75B|nr:MULTISPECIES: hypothetical protein [Agrobacterium tumefaciens complex]KAB0459932.1 hypothetical protein F7R04_13655 [Agrobacterium tumefaciens]KWT76935.1 hypothetical protein ASH09_11290 [Agrobacterium radiobacter]NIB11288.1 hypothetical protein [Agrobacterium radiobacter]OOO38408.1 hypothetical protein BS628_09760 [Agrobacterium radiobacter]
MTAFMIKPYHDRVEILTDGATYTPDGVLLSTSYKVHRCEFLPLAIVGSGSVSAIDSIAAMILQAVEVTCSIDDCLALLAGSLQKILPTACGEIGSKTEHVRIGIAAISETSGPLCFYFNSFDDADSKAFTLLSMPRGFGQGMEPSHEDIMANIANLKGTNQTLKHDGPWLFEQMRRKKSAYAAFPDGPSTYNVGGHLDFTIMTADGYNVERLVTWPDVIGQPIDPFALDTALRAAVA